MAYIEIKEFPNRGNFTAEQMYVYLIFSLKKKPTCTFTTTHHQRPAGPYFCFVNGRKEKKNGNPQLST